MKRKYRIAFGRFMQETNSFSSVETTLKDFKRTHFVEGDELLKVCQANEVEVKGFLKNLELSGFIKAVNAHKDKEIEVVPLVSTWSISGGPLAKADFDEICNMFKEKLKKEEPFDAIFLALHGAMEATGEKDADAKFIKELREVVGTEIPIIATMDLHANLTKEKVSVLNFLCAYHTNPHWDMARTGFKAGDILIKTIAGEVKPTTTWRSLPMLLGGGITIDFLPPMRHIFQRIKQLEEDPRVLYCSVFMLHPYLSHPDLGWGIYVITDNNQDLAEAIADELANKCWEMRKKQPPKFLEVEEAIEKVRSYKLLRKLGSIAICDASDVVGAGGTGENTALLKYLLDNAKDLVSLVPIRAPQVIDQLWDKMPNENIEVVVGGMLQPEINDPVTISGKIINKKDTDNFGKVLVLDAGCVKLVVTEGYAMPMKPSFYEDLGLDTLKADIVVVKNFFHFRLYYFAKSRKALYVKSKGITDFDRIMKIETNDPVYPKDEVDDWKKTDAKRRGISATPNLKKDINRFNLQRSTKKRNLKYLTAFSILALLLVLFKKKKK